ncbi:hypothetical protein JCM8208_005529 [Rhodotorula glutinis]
MAHNYATPPATPSRERLSGSSSLAPSTRPRVVYRLSPHQRAPQNRSPAVKASMQCGLNGELKMRPVGVLKSIRSLGRRQWRAVLLVGVLLVVAAYMSIYMVLRWSARPALVIPKRPWVPQRYRHLDDALPTSLHPSTRVLHVAKEFGPATMGGLGVMLTALSVAQAESSNLSVAVVLPHYSYLRDLYSPDQAVPFANLSVPFMADQSTGRVHHVACAVSLLQWQYTPALDFLDVPVEARQPEPRSIDVYLVGPGTERPFSSAFQASDAGDIYSAYKPLKQEWKDLYFARAATELVRHLGTDDPAIGLDDRDDDGARALSSSTTSRLPVDVVHLHGATNAMVAYYLRDGQSADHAVESTSTRAAPAVVYTLHDSLDEVEYSNLASNVEHFVAPAERRQDALASLRPYLYRDGTQLFTSALGIDLADMTTFVSRSIAADIVAGTFRFHLEDLIMPSVAARAARGEFVGVTNGLDFTERSRNPFTNDALVAHGLAFPHVGADVLDPSTFGASFVSAKARARALVVEQLPHLFAPDDVERPWFLFIGRYQYNKGCQLFSSLVDLLSSPSVNGRLILLGARNNYPFDDLTRLAKRYPRHITLVDDRTPTTSTIQAEWGAHLRLASDVAFVPSLSEAFGLVAAEALLFGMPVLSTGVGGLREFLVPSPEPHANSYLFDLFPRRRRGDPLSSSTAQGAEEDYSQAAHDVRPDEAQLAPTRLELRRAAEQALRDWRARRDGPVDEQEPFVRRLIADALALSWDREGGPVEEYQQVYSQALELRRRRRRIPLADPSSPSPDLRQPRPPPSRVA